MKNIYLQSDSLTKISTISHGFFTKNGGVSDGIYSSLNCGYGSDDISESVTENRKIVEQSLNGKKTPLVTLYQIHSSDVVTITDTNNIKNLPKADAMVTNQKNIILGVLTADCAPILFCDTETQVIGAAHAGWQGALSGVAENTIAAMEKLGAKRKSILAVIGPCIGQSSYEVGAEFYDNFLQHDKDNKDFFINSVETPQKHHFDLKAYVASQLAKSDIENINIMANDTCAESELFFSNRRRNLQGEPDYGRQVSAIMLK